MNTIVLATLPTVQQQINRIGDILQLTYAHHDAFGDITKKIWLVVLDFECKVNPTEFAD